MANNPFFIIGLIIIGLAVSGYCQYEDESSRGWQPSRVQRTQQNPSRFGKSSPQIPSRQDFQQINFETPRSSFSEEVPKQRNAGSRQNIDNYRLTPATGRSGNLQENSRTQEQFPSRNSFSRSENPSRSQTRNTPTSRGRNNIRIIEESSLSTQNVDVPNFRSNPRREPAFREASRSSFDAPVDVMTTVGLSDQFVPQRLGSSETRTRQSSSEQKSSEPLGDFQRDLSVEQNPINPSARASLRPGPTVSDIPSRSSQRRPYQRGPSQVDTRHKPTEENEVTKPIRSRGRPISNAPISTPSETASNYEIRATSGTPQAGFSDAAGKSNERQASRRFPRPQQVQPQKVESHESNEQPSLRRGSLRTTSTTTTTTTTTTSTTPIPPTTGRRQNGFRPSSFRTSSLEKYGSESAEQSDFTMKFNSREETSTPEETRIPVTQTTEGYTDLVENNARRQVTRGRVKASTEKPSSSIQTTKGASRGEKKASLSAQLKRDNDDEISEEDNYPKEFIEKIKSSAENSRESQQKNTFVPSGNRSGRSKLLPSTTIFNKPGARAKLHDDSDVSESINEETVEQDLSPFVKAKSLPTYKNRYFGKAKTTTTTTSTTAPTVPKLNRPGPSTNVDVLRQRYRDKLKQSQEERQQKLANLRPKLSKDGQRAERNKEISTTEKIPDLEQPVTSKSYTKVSASSFRPISRYSRPQKNKQEQKSPVLGSEGAAAIKFRPRFSLAPREPDSSLEPATPTVAENARTRNRYSRLRKEELSVETPEAKTTWNSDSFRPKKVENAYNFIRLRTKDLTPLASEDVHETLINNDINDVSSSSEISKSTSTESTTIRVPETSGTETQGDTTSTSSSEEQTSPATISASVTEAFTKETTQVRITTTEAIDEKQETIMPSSQASASTRFRFSSRYIGSTNPTLMPEVSTTVSEEDIARSTLSIENLISSSLSSDLNSPSPSSSFETTSAPSTPSLVTITENTPSSVITTTVVASTKMTMPEITTLKKTTKTKTTPSSTTTTTQTVPKSTITTTQAVPTSTTASAPSFLENRPILRNLISLFAPSSTTTKKPKTAKAKQAKSSKPKAKPKSKSTTSTTPFTTPSSSSTPSSTTVLNTSTESTVNATVPQPVALNAEVVINSTQEIISNKTSIGSAFSKIPREELNALTPSTFINTTEASKTNSSDVLVERLTLNASTEMENVTSQSIFFDYGSSSPSPPVQTTVTTPSTTTAGDYFVYGIYPNNTVVKKRAWKTFDYEKYMSPYVIFGIYPNNTIIRKFPNGTIINDEFMTSDNEIGDKPSSTTTIRSFTSSTTEEIITVAGTEESVEETTTESQEMDDNEDAVTENSIEENTIESSTEEDSTTTVSSLINEEENDDSSTTIVVMIDDDGDENSNISEDEVNALFRSNLVSSTTTTDSGNTETTTVDPSINQVLPLSMEEVESLWTGNFSRSLKVNSSDSAMSSSITVGQNVNVLKDEGKSVSLTNLAYRALSTSGSTETSTRPAETTTETKDFSSSRKPRVKFVTLTPGLPTTTDSIDDAITLSSQHVQKVTKAPLKNPDDVLTSVFGSLEQEASSALPDIFKDVGNEVSGDGLTAALARRIIALAMERAKSTTTEGFTSFTSTTREPMTTTTPAAPTTVRTTTTTLASTIPPTKAPKKKQTTRTTSKKPNPEAEKALASLPVGTDLQDVLQKLLQAQTLEAAALSEKTGSTTIKAPIEMEKTVENQIRLAEEVRKASRTMKKKKKKAKTTTTPAPPPFLGFLFNFFNRPPPAPAQVPSRTAKKVKTASVAPASSSQVLLLTSLPQPADVPSATDFPESEEVQEQQQTRGQLLTAAIDVTRAVSKFMGTVITNAAQSFQSFMRGGGWG